MGTLTTAIPVRQILGGIGHAALVVVLLLALLTGCLALFQRRLIYPLGFDGAPVPSAPAGFRALPTDGLSGRMTVWIADGRRDRPVLLFLHGNATSIEGSAYVTRPFRDAGWTVVVPEYPGYPGSDGSPSQSGLSEAARMGWRTALAGGRNPGDVLIMGNSIGSGPAIALAAETSPRGLAIVSGVASLPDVIRARLPFIPDFLVKDRFYNAHTLSGVRSPVTVIHGDRDDVVPHDQGVRLAAAAGIPLVTVPGGHDIIAHRPVLERILRRYE